ncbi:MAG TPA: phosphopantothenoylcysteine decarboxylase, partial [Longimicrobiales bacterium]|nr:phosphopantothenoylcysteine decarboxylase [Longimicrobiales bacterium]
EPGEIVEHLGRALGEEPRYRDRSVLVTAGPTREPIDPVRFVGNRSSGRMGDAVARAAWRRGARVALVSGPTSLPDPPGVDVVRVETAREMHEAVRERIGEADVSVFAAAVADFRPARAHAEKLKRSSTGGQLDLSLAANPDIAAATRSLRRAGGVAVGFALETGDLLANAKEKLEAKGFDLLVANDVTEEGAGFEVETNRVTILDREGEPEELPLLPKDEVAERILDRVGGLLPGEP